MAATVAPVTTRLPAAAVVLTAVALTGCAGDPKPAAAPTPAAATSRAPLPITVRGTFTLERPNFVWSETTHQCAGQRAADDIRAGSQIIVTDPAGVNVAVGELDTGQPVMDTTDPNRAASCLFQFRVPNVPSGKGIYGVEVAGRGKVQFPEAQLAASIALGLT